MVCRGLKQKNALIACIRARENCDFLVFFFVEYRFYFNPSRTVRWMKEWSEIAIQNAFSSRTSVVTFQCACCWVICLLLFQGIIGASSHVCRGNTVQRQGVSIAYLNCKEDTCRTVEPLYKRERKKRDGVIAFRPTPKHQETALKHTSTRPL